jgi:hypothetical protein
MEMMSLTVTVCERGLVREVTVHTWASLINDVSLKDTEWTRASETTTKIASRSRHLLTIELTALKVHRRLLLKWNLIRIVRLVWLALLLKWWLLLLVLRLVRLELLALSLCVTSLLCQPWV